jgi:hypothetical protein
MEKGTTLAIVIAAFLLAIVPAWAGSPNLGTSSNFAVLAGSTITNTGSTNITGDIGVSPGSAITGFPPGTVEPPYTTYKADAVAAQAELDASTAYVNLAATPFTDDLTGDDLGGRVLTPGVYNFDTSGQLTGGLTLDGAGDYQFHFGSTLTTASGSSVTLENGANANDVFWQVGSSATLGTNTAFMGSIIADTSVTLNTGASIIDGRAIALNGAVTLDDNTIDIPVAAPETSSIAGLGLGIMLLIGMSLNVARRRLTTSLDA